MDKKLISTSKFLSLVLRHQPEVIGMKLDAEGWLDIDKLIEKANERGRSLTLEHLHDVVVQNDKKRFALSEDGLRIRASQGHSVKTVELHLVPLDPPDILYHGTIEAFLDSIRSQGLDKRSRNHVHLSQDEATAKKVGARRGKPVILKVKAQKMSRDGHPFYRSDNMVWLTDHVSVGYLEFPE